MLRVECIEPADGHMTVRLHGRVGGPWVGELRELCHRLLGQGPTPLQIDLEHVTFIDHDGLALFDELWDAIVVVRSSLFAQELLKTLGRDRTARGRHDEHTHTDSHTR